MHTSGGKHLWSSPLEVSANAVGSIRSVDLSRPKLQSYITLPLSPSRCSLRRTAEPPLDALTLICQVHTTVSSDSSTTSNTLFYALSSILRNFKQHQTDQRKSSDWNTKRDNSTKNKNFTCAVSIQQESIQFNPSSSSLRESTSTSTSSKQQNVIVAFQSTSHHNQSQCASSRSPPRLLPPPPCSPAHSPPSHHQATSLNRPLRRRQRTPARPPLITPLGL